MIRENEVLEGVENRYRRRMDDLVKQKTIIDNELSNLEAYVSTLREIRTREIGGNFIVAAPTTKAKTSPQPLPDERGWLKQRCIEYASARGKVRFGGGDVARWLRDCGYRLKPFQYNQIFLILREMAKEKTIIRRVDSRYEVVAEPPPQTELRVVSEQRTYNEHI